MQTIDTLIQDTMKEVASKYAEFHKNKIMRAFSDNYIVDKAQERIIKFNLLDIEAHDADNMYAYYQIVTQIKVGEEWTKGNDCTVKINLVSYEMDTTTLN